MPPTRRPCLPPRSLTAAASACSRRAISSLPKPQPHPQLPPFPAAATNPQQTLQVIAADDLLPPPAARKVKAL